MAESMYSDRSRIPMNPAIPLSYQHAMVATRTHWRSTQGIMGRFAYAGGRSLY